MLLKTILNKVEPFKSFTYGKVRWVEDAGVSGGRELNHVAGQLRGASGRRPLAAADRRRSGGEVAAGYGGN